MSIFSTVLAWKDKGCPLSRTERIGCGVVIRISTSPANSNRISSLWDHHLARSNLTKSMSGISSDQLNNTLTSSVNRLYTVNQIYFRFFLLIRNSIVHSSFWVNKVHLLLGSLIILACIVAIVSTPGAPNVSSASGNNPSRLPIFC